MLISLKKILTVLTFSLAFSQANAVEYPTFTIDTSASSVVINGSDCWPYCGATPEINPALADQSFSLAASGRDSRHRIRDFVTWSAIGSAIGVYDIAVNIAFSSPDDAIGTTGGGGALLNLTGRIVAGIIDWDREWTSVLFAQGSEIEVSLKDSFLLGDAGSIASALRIRAVNLVPMTTPSPVPLPASLPLLLALIAGGGYAARRRNRMMAQGA